MAFPDHLLEIGQPDLTPGEDELHHFEAENSEVVLQVVLPMSAVGFEVQRERFREALKAVFLDVHMARECHAPMPLPVQPGTSPSRSEVTEVIIKEDGVSVQDCVDGQPQIRVEASIIFNRRSYPPMYALGWGRWTTSNSGGDIASANSEELLDLFQSFDMDSDGKIAATVSHLTCAETLVLPTCFFADRRTLAHNHSSRS